MSASLADRLHKAATFLRVCRGTEPAEYFEEHAQTCYRAADLLKAGERAHQWQPIETYSDDGEVVVWNGHQAYRGYYQDPDGWFADVDGEMLRIDPAPTHWARLPFEPWKEPDMEEFCLGCGRPTERDCGCPAGTAWRKTK